LEISRDLAIDASSLPSLLTVDAGNGSDDTLGTGDGMRIFNIDDDDELNDIAVEISGLILTGGDVSGDGGAIRSTETLQLVDSTITGNATGDGGIGNPGGRGGGIWSTGSLTLNGSTVSGNSTGKGGDGAGYGGNGGGIYSNGGVLSINNSTISGNATGDGGDRGGLSFAGYGGDGAGIYFDGGNNANGTLTITNSILSGNSTGYGGSGSNLDSYQGDGGGIIAWRATTIISGSTISGNIAYYGSGISNYGVATISGSTISENLGSFGAGILNVNSMEITESTISANTGDKGGGILNKSMMTLHDSTVSDNTASYGGGGIYNGGTITLTNTTVSGNMADTSNSGSGFGGGLANSGTMTVQHSTITGNTAPVGRGSGVSSDGYVGGNTSTEIRSSIIAGNTNSDVDVVNGATHSFVSLNYNLIGTSASVPDALTAFTGGGDQTEVANPQLGPLADNGGPTWTHALQSGSPAIDAGDPADTAGVGTVPLYDQRGSPHGRVLDGGPGTHSTIDIGAFELAALTSPSADFDTDGDIDGKDFLSWQRGYGTTAPNGTKQAGDANDDQNVDEQDLGIWQQQFGSTPEAAVASETLILSDTNQPFLGEAIVLLALEGTNSQQTDIFDLQPTGIRIAEELVSNPLPVSLSREIPLSREYASHSQDKVPDEQKAATDEAFTTLAADDLSMGRLALNISW
jgi:hypothetical protein